MITSNGKEKVKQLLKLNMPSLPLQGETLFPRVERKPEITRYWNNKNVTIRDSCSPHVIDIHQISKSGEISSCNCSQCINWLNHIGKVNWRQRVITLIEASAWKWHHKVQTHIKHWRIITYGISLPKLIRGHQTPIYWICNGRESIGRSSPIMSRHWFSNTINTRTGDRDFEEELGRENVVLYIRVRDVNGIGSEKCNRVYLKERSNLRGLEVSVKCVAKKSIAWIIVGAWLYSWFASHWRCIQ